MAIARKNSAFGSFANPGTSLTWAFDCGSGADLLLVAAVGDVATDNITGVTYNGAAMSLWVNQAAGASSRQVALYAKYSPASGSNNIVISANNGFILGLNVSYSGTSGSGPDNSTTNTNSVDTALTTALTTVADNCWTVLVSGMSGRPQHAGTGSTFVVEETSFQGAFAIYDSNGPITPPASYSMQSTADFVGLNQHIMVSIAPPGAASTGNHRTPGGGWGGRVICG